MSFVSTKLSSITGEGAVTGRNHRNTDESPHRLIAATETHHRNIDEPELFSFIEGGNCDHDAVKVGFRPQRIDVISNQ